MRANSATLCIPPVATRGPRQRARREGVGEVVERPGHDHVVVDAHHARDDAHADAQA